MEEGSLFCNWISTAGNSSCTVSGLSWCSRGLVSLCLVVGQLWAVSPAQDLTDQNDAHRAVSHEDRLKEFRLLSLEGTRLQGDLKAPSNA